MPSFSCFSSTKGTIQTDQVKRLISQMCIGLFQKQSCIISIQKPAGFILNQVDQAVLLRIMLCRNRSNRKSTQLHRFIRHQFMKHNRRIFLHPKLFPQASPSKSTDLFISIYQKWTLPGRFTVISCTSSGQFSAIKMIRMRMCYKYSFQLAQIQVPPHFLIVNIRGKIN